jgi:uncharacterized membrane protein YfcA
MELELWTIALLCVAYFTAGFIDSIAGGGGLITMPCILLAGIPPDLAFGTNKLASSCGLGAAMASYARNGLVLWRAAPLGIPAVLIGASIGGAVLLSLDNDTIGKVVVVLLPLGIFATFLPKKDRGEKRVGARQFYILLPLICLTLGFYEGIFGPGAGSFFILALHFLLGFGLLQASATTKLLNFAATASSCVIFIIQGKVLYMLALPLAAFSIAGNIAGSRTAMRIGAGFVRTVLSFSLTLLFASLVWKFWFGA